MCKKLIFLIPFVFTLVAISGLATAEEIWREAESADPMTAPMETYSDDPLASGGEYIGVAIGNSSTSAPPAPDGTASYIIDVPAAGTYKLVGRVKVLEAGGQAIADNDSCWIRIDGATINSTVLTNGFYKWNNIDAIVGSGGQWQWVDSFNNDDGNKVMEFTMDAGQYVLEVAYREDGMYFDGFLLTTDLALDESTLPDEIPSAGPSCTEPENILTNGGFEDSVIDPWQVTGDGLYEIVGDAEEGSNAIKIPTTTGANGYDKSLRYPGLTFEAGKKYTYSIFLKGSSDGMTVHMKPEIDGSPYTGYNEQDFTITDEWAEYSVTTDVFSSEVTPAALSLWLAYQDGDVYADHARWYEGDYAPPCAPAGPPTITGTYQTTVANTDWAATPQDITALSDDGDWRLWDELGTPVYEKDTSDELITDLMQILSFGAFNPGDQNFSWSDGVAPVSTASTGVGVGSRNVGEGLPLGGGYSVDVTLPTGTGDITVWAGTRSGPGRLIILDGSEEILSLDGDDRSNVWGLDRFDIIVSSYPSNTVLTIQWILADDSDTSARINFYGVAVASKSAIPQVVVKATKPDPAKGTSDLPRSNVLSWTPGEYADMHDVYLGSSKEDVENGDASVLVSAGQTDAFYVTSGLDYGITYYWRIDGINSEDMTVYPGDVWSFSTKAIGLIVPPEAFTVTASSTLNTDQVPENTINLSGLDADDMHSDVSTDMWLSDNTAEPDKAWIQYDLDQLYKVPRMLIWNYNDTGFFSVCAMKEITIEYSSDGGENWAVLEGVPELQQSNPNPEIIDFGGVADGLIINAVRITANSNFGAFPLYGLSEVRFYYVDVWPKDPVPADGTTNIDMDVTSTLSWTPGEGVVEHVVYFGTDEQAVIDGTAPSAIVTDPSLDVDLMVGTQYFWRVEEVNMSEVWSGPVWSFTVRDYRIVDDFEGYTNSLQNWSSGSSWWANGAAVSLGAIARTGNQSMQFMYDNTLYTSTAEGYSQTSVNPSNLDAGRNWLAGGCNYLVFWIYGDIDNADTEQMYVKLGDKLYRNIHPLSEIKTPWWTQVTIPLAHGNGSLMNMSNFSIGFARNAREAGTGVIHVDDLRLYAVPPVPIEPMNPGDANLVAHYKMQNNVNDSAPAPKINGVAAGDPNYVDGPYPNYGKAIEFDANDDYVDLGPAAPFNFTGSFSIAFWVNIQEATNGSKLIATRGEDNMGFSVNIRSASFGTWLRFTTHGIPMSGFFGINQYVLSGIPEVGEWVHVVCIFDADNATKTVYYDGAPVQQDSVSGLLSPSTSNASLGGGANADNTGFESLFNGMLDDVRFYDKALSAEEIRFLCDPTP